MSSFPESPRWLAMKGRDEEALAALARLHAHGDTEDPLVKFEFEDILASIKAETPDTNPYVRRAAPSPLNGPAQFCRLTRPFEQHRYKELFTKMYNFRPLLLGIIIQFSVQMTGVSALQYCQYSVEWSICALLEDVAELSPPLRLTHDLCQPRFQHHSNTPLPELQQHQYVNTAEQKHCLRRQLMNESFRSRPRWRAGLHPVG